MSEEEAIETFVRDLAARCRSLPIGEAVPILRGALAISDHPALAGLRGTFRDLVSADDQLELIASAQLKLNLNAGGSQ